MKKNYSVLARLLLVVFLALGFSRPALVLADNVTGSIWTTTSGCGAQNVNHYEVGDTVYVRYANFELGQYALTIDQVSGPDKTRVEGPVTLTLKANGCFAAHTISASEAGNEYTLDLGKGHNDNYGVNKAKTATPTTTITPTETTPAVTVTTPDVIETTPAVVETTPAVIETTPAVVETTPAVIETTPTVVETTPAVIETTPAVVETTPAVVETTPVVVETTPAAPEATLAVPEITSTLPAGSSGAVDPIVTSAPVIAPVVPASVPVVLQIPVTGQTNNNALYIPVTGSRVIVAGFGHTCMTMNDGRVVCWGLNTSGQVGNGTSVDQWQAVYVMDLSGVMNLTAGSLHTCALTSDNEVWCWGENSSGQLGNGSIANSSIPVLVTGLPAKVISFTAGEAFTCAQLDNNETWCWGENGLGQLNDGTTIDRSNPVKSILSSDQIAISGGQSSLLSSSFLDVTAWSSQQNNAVQNINSPLSISANRWNEAGCAVTGDGTINCWDFDHSSFIVSSLLPALEVDAGSAHNCVLNDDLTVSCWGNNDRGQLGNGTNADSTSARLIDNLVKVHDLAVGANHTCVLQGFAQAALCWGENTYGQLGIKSTNDSNTPRWVYPPIEN